MAQGQNGKKAPVFIEGKHFAHGPDIRNNILVRKYHALWLCGCPRGVYDLEDIVLLYLRFLKDRWGFLDLPGEVLSVPPLKFHGSVLETRLNARLCSSLRCDVSDEIGLYPYVQRDGDDPGNGTCKQSGHPFGTVGRPQQDRISFDESVVLEPVRHAVGIIIHVKVRHSD